MAEMRIALIHRNNGSDPRLLKIAASLTKAGHELVFVGWDIHGGARKPADLKVADALVLHTRRALGFSGLAHLHRFACCVLKALLRWRPDAVHCVNEEMALMTLPWRGVLFRWLVCDLFDSMRDRVLRQSPYPLNLTVRVGSWLALYAADRIIVTDERRLERLAGFASKATVVANVPPDPGPELAKRFPSGPIKVFVSGSIDVNRGLTVLKQAVQRIEGVRVVAAGWYTNTLTEQILTRSPEIEWHGQVTPEESLRLAAACDAVFAYYEPSNFNNIYASPNKVFDAMSVGRPVIVNSETVISSWVLENQLGYSAPYHDADKLATILRSLGPQRRALAEFAVRARSIYEREFTWEIMEQRLLGIYAQLSGRRPRRA